MKERDEDWYWMVCYFVITWLLILFSGCHTDNRVRVKPTITHNHQNPELRLHVMRMMWADAQMRHYEKELNPTD